MIVGVVGNRVGFTKERVFEELDKLKLTSKDVIVTGGAVGVDSFAEDYAHINDIGLEVYYPVLSEPIPIRYFNRNRNIAIRCSILVAFDKKKGASGTKNTMKYAKTLRKRVILIDS